MRPDRIGLGVTVAMHALALAFLFSYAPARKALLAAAPIMVDFILPPRVDQPKPQTPTALPKSRPAARPVERPNGPPVTAAPLEAPSQAIAPPPIAAVVTPPETVPVTQPQFNASYLDNSEPAYPALSRRLGEQGRVILRVLVNARGTADEVQLRTPSGFARLDEAARDTVSRWRFVPARRGAEPVPAWVLIPISFRLEG